MKVKTYKLNTEIAARYTVIDDNYVQVDLQQIKFDDVLHCDYQVVVNPPIVGPLPKITAEKLLKIEGKLDTSNLLVYINEDATNVHYDGVLWHSFYRLHNGENILKFKAKNKYGQYSREIIKKVTLDQESPKTTIVINGQTYQESIITNQNVNVELKVTNKDLDNVTSYYKLDGQLFVYNKAIPFSTPGIYNITYWSEDFLGNRELPKNFIVEIDVIAPQMPIIISYPEVTKEVLALVIGEKSVDANKIYVNNNSTDVTYIDDTNWQVEVSLIEGINDFSFLAEDAAGNRSDSVEIQIKKDTIPPSIPYLTDWLPVTNQQCQIIKGIKSFDTAQILVNNSSNNVRITGNFYWEADLCLNEGINIITIHSVDKVGNISIPNIYRFELKTAPPEQPTLNPVTSPTNQLQQQVSGTRAASTNIFVNNDTFHVIYPSATTWTYWLPLESGNNIINIVAQDFLGNNSEPVFGHIVVDLTLPIAPLIQNLQDWYSVGTIAIEGTKTEDVIEVFINGNSENITYVDSLHWTTTLTGYQTGEHLLKVSGRNSIGNISEEREYTFNVDLTIPHFNVDETPDVTGLSTLEITGTKSKNSIILVNNSSSGVQSVYSEQTWSAILYLTKGINEFTLKAKNLANVESEEINFNIFYDDDLDVNFTIDSIWAIVDSSEEIGAKEITLEGTEKRLPILLKDKLAEQVLKGRKSPNTELITSGGKVFYPQEISGIEWMLVFSIQEESNGLFIQFKNEDLLSEAIRITAMYILQNTHTGDIIIEFGRRKINLLTGQEILLSDFQLDLMTQTSPEFKNIRDNNLFVLTKIDKTIGN